ncbi:type II toxin-antitoxin system RelE/ParE family toxin [Glaciimonas immobilis]|uniref:type II toxin-antitoxin system RelE/ParE family toxin n=1 Tax=Glaciimonas immobilis TaxID=728004 RepID=UPI001FD81F8F|nr:type II toxin-antitoxin system RelE/ParE family toxin [Glaciimonas immobilis]
MQDRTDIWNNISEDSPRAAARMNELFSDAGSRLVTHPQLGKSGAIRGTRELIAHENNQLPLSNAICYLLKLPYPVPVLFPECFVGI